jgi:hypothetical protein
MLTFHTRIGKLAVLEFSNASHADPARRVELRDARAIRIARILRDYRINYVVLNACFTANSMHGRISNLGRVLLQYGVRSVSAMWHYVNYETARIYVSTFYESVLFHGDDFATAAQKGRDVLRKDERRWEGRPNFQDSFVCVAYRREDQEMLVVPTLSRSRRLSAASEATTLGTPATGSVVDPDEDLERAVSGDTTRQRQRFLRALDKMRQLLSVSKDEEIPPPVLPQPDNKVFRMTLLYLDFELNLRKFRVLYVSDRSSDKKQQDMAQNVKNMAMLWLDTNMLRHVAFYKGWEFIKKSRPSPSSGPFESDANAHYSFKVEPLGGVLHIIRGIDFVLDSTNNNEIKIGLAKLHLEEFLNNLPREDYVIFLGAHDQLWWHSQWWTTGQFWAHSKSFKVRLSPRASNRGVRYWGH